MKILNILFQIQMNFPFIYYWKTLLTKFFKTSSFHSKRGISFIEVIYSIVLLASTLAILSHMSSQSTTHLKRSNRYHTVSQLMENMLTDLELRYQESGPSVLSYVENETIENFPDFSWSLETQPAQGIDMLQLQNIPLDPRITSQLEILNNKFIELITEIKLSIHYNKEKEPTTYSITKYFIDFKRVKEPEFFAELQGTIEGLESFVEN